MKRLTIRQSILSELPTEKCIPWPGNRDRSGYGRASERQRLSAMAHRDIYMRIFGFLPAEIQLDHLCHNRACVNPAHLEPVTSAENAARAREAFSPFDPRTHCRNGHEWTAANTYRKPNGGRDCRACIRSRVSSYKSRKQTTA